MPLVTEFDVHEAVKARWAATAGVPAAFPGGLHPERKPAGKSWPYAVARVTPERVEGDSSRLYFLTFGVELTAWAETGTAARALRALLDLVMAESSLTVPNAVRFIRVWPRPGRLQLAPELRQGSDVLAAAGRWWVRVDADRGS
jgi:hypothetical protein